MNGNEAGRQQMLSCLYNPNLTNTFLQQKFKGHLAHPLPIDKDRHTLSHMPTARPIGFFFFLSPITIAELFVVFCNDLVGLRFFFLFLFF